MWTNRYSGPAGGDDQAKAVIVDSSANVLVTGHSMGSGPSFDYLTINYSSAGAPVWTNGYDGPAKRRIARELGRVKKRAARRQQADE